MGEAISLVTGLIYYLFALGLLSWLQKYNDGLMSRMRCLLVRNFPDRNLPGDLWLTRRAMNTVVATSRVSSAPYVNLRVAATNFAANLGCMVC